jgi:hypothetical protein
LVGSHHLAMGAFLFCAGSPTDQAAMAATTTTKSHFTLACDIESTFLDS